MTSYANTDKYTMEKFNGKNFHLWKFKIQMILEEKDLWDIVSGDKIMPEKDTFHAIARPQDAKKKQIEQKQATARSISLSRPLQQTIMTKTAGISILELQHT